MKLKDYLSLYNKKNGDDEKLDRPFESWLNGDLESSMIQCRYEGLGP